MHDGTFPVLLKTLSDPSEEVIKANLQLLAQISSSSEEDYFPLFMQNLLSLFSTDRKLLETRGTLIIRQLCLSLNTERIYRTFAELLEKDEVRSEVCIVVRIPLTAWAIGFGFRKHHGSESTPHNDHIARAVRLSQTSENARIQRRPDPLFQSLSVLVAQRSRGFFTMPSCASLRACSQSIADFVSRLPKISCFSDAHAI